MQKGDKWVVGLVAVIALLIIAYFAVNHYWLSDRPATASTDDPPSNAESADSANGADPDENGQAEAEPISFWDGIDDGQRVQMWLYGPAEAKDTLATAVQENAPEVAGWDLHNEETNERFLIQSWLDVVAQEDPLPVNSIVLFHGDLIGPAAGNLTTFEMIVHQLLHAQPSLAIGVVFDEADPDIQADATNLIERYHLNVLTVDELQEQIPHLAMAQMATASLHDGVPPFTASEHISTGQAYGEVDQRPLSSDDHPYLFDQYYALYGADAQVDFDVTGDRVGVVYLTDANGGMAEVTVNGSKVGEFDGYSAELSQQVAWIPLDGSDTPHTVSIRYTGEQHENATDSQVFVTGLIVAKSD